MEVMTSISNERDVVHHLYVNPGDGLEEIGDLLPFCGTVPGRDRRTGDWHTGHARDLLIELISDGAVGCTTCLSPEALGGWTPLIIEDALDQERSGSPEDQWWID